MALSRKERILIKRIWNLTNDSQETFETDGGAGSGNWGHKGRPGKRGGSGQGGGKKYRSGSKEEGYSQKKLDDPIAASNKYTSSGSAGLSRGSGQKFTPGAKKPAAPTSAPKAESAAVSDLRNAIKNGANLRTLGIRLDKFKPGTTINWTDKSGEKWSLTKTPEKPDGSGGWWEGTHNGKYDNAVSQDLGYTLKNAAGFDVTEPSGGSQGETAKQPKKSAGSAMNALKPNGFSVVGSGDAKAATNMVQDLVDNHKGAVLMTNKEAFWVGNDGMIHSSSGYDIDPKDTEQMQNLAEGSYMWGVNSEGSFDTEATKNLIDQAITKGKGGEAFDALPSGTKLMFAGSLFVKNDDNSWIEAGMRGMPYADDGDAFASALAGMSGFNGATAARDIENKGFMLSPMGYGDGGYLVTPIGIISPNTKSTSNTQPREMLSSPSSVSQTSQDPFARSMSRTGTAEGLKKAVNGLLQTKQGSMFFDASGNGYFVGYDGKLHSTDGFVVNPNDKRDMDYNAKQGTFKGNGALVSEAKMDRDTTRNLLDRNNSQKTIASMPAGAKIMMPPLGMFVKSDNGWTNTSPYSGKETLSDNDLFSRISNIKGFGNPDAVERSGFVTRSNNYEHRTPFIAIMPNSTQHDSAVKSTDERGLTELASW